MCIRINIAYLLLLRALTSKVTELPKIVTFGISFALLLTLLSTVGLLLIVRRKRAHLIPRVARL